MRISKQKIILKGIPASSGVVNGKARIILSPKECKKMKKGNILVTEMTDPLYMPAMRKVKAIVTDHGGLLCHAAIVSVKKEKIFKIASELGLDIEKADKRHYGEIFYDFCKKNNYPFINEMTFEKEKIWLAKRL